MDLGKILNMAKEQAKIHKGLMPHVQKMHDSNKKELDEIMPNMFKDLNEMIKNKDFEGIKSKNKEFLGKIKEKEDASKRSNNR